MAKNQVHDDGGLVTYDVACSAPTTPASGDPVLYGQLPGVALTAENAAGLTTIATNGVWLLDVEGANNAGATAVAVGDILYYDTAATVKINKDNTNGVRFGYALDAVGSGATANIRVKVGY
jgi:predicted RecA/RadA family phage recombinase